MIRSIMALIAGFFSISIFEVFVRLIISAYRKNEIILSGVDGFSSGVIVIALTAAGLLFGLIGGLITCSMAYKKPAIEILSLILLIAAGALFSFYFEPTTQAQPLWYLIIYPLLKIGGVFSAWKLHPGYQQTTHSQPS